MDRHQFDQLARDKAGAPKLMPDSKLDRDFFVKGPHNAQLPPEQWPTHNAKGRLQPGAAGELAPMPKQACNHGLCDGSGQRLLKSNPATGTKTYALCPCRGGRG